MVTPSTTVSTSVVLFSVALPPETKARAAKSISPPGWMVRLLTNPPEDTTSRPLLITVAPMAEPPCETISTPPLSRVVPLSMPPLLMIRTPPDETAPAKL